MSMRLVGDMNSKVSHPLKPYLKGRKIVLGSQSPRRADLLAQLGISFEVRTSYAPEDHSSNLSPREVPIAVAKQKADYLLPDLSDDEVLITADTLVALDDQVLEKPDSLDTAHTFLSSLSGRWHEVITGFCLTAYQQQFVNSVVSRVRFNQLREDEIAYYLSHYQVLDKAGAYGIQDWIGLVGVAEVEGSFYNVMGLPTAQLYQDLRAFLAQSSSLF